MNNVGTWLGRSVAARCAPDPGEHLRRRHCQSPSPECAHHGQMRCDRRFRHPIPGKSRPHAGRVVGEKPWTCRRVETFLWYCDQCACSPSGILSARAKGCWGWARQHRQRGDMLWIAVGEQPGEAATPIMANQMKRRSPCPVAATKWSAPPICRNGHRATVGSSRRSPGLTAGP